VYQVLLMLKIYNHHKLKLHHKDRKKRMNNYIKPVSAGFSSSSSVILSRNVHHFGALPNVYK